MFSYSTHTVGSMAVNAYILSDSKQKDAIVIDPGAEPDAIRLALRGKNLKAILLTHGHVDHIGAVAALREGDVPVYIHKKDADMLTNPNLSLAAMFNQRASQGEADFDLTDGTLTLCGLTISVLHTPGHTPGSCCFLVDNILFSGDTLFEGGVGRTDLPGGDDNKLKKSVSRLIQMEPDIIVCPGHGLSTTIRAERRYYR
jgi:glyoxylase-like metal-dependent hydrolase (beta-lactamase superfamily II)